MFERVWSVFGFYKLLIRALRFSWQEKSLSVRGGNFFKFEGGQKSPHISGWERGGVNYCVWFMKKQPYTDPRGFLGFFTIYKSKITNWILIVIPNFESKTFKKNILDNFERLIVENDHLFSVGGGGGTSIQTK